MNNDYEFEKVIDDSKNVVIGVFTIEFRAIRTFISKLFYNKNTFGKLIGVFITIVSIPAIVFITIAMVFILIYKLGKIIYLLGDKK